MFTGLIEKVGILQEKISKGNMLELTIVVDDMWSDLVLGESIAINGTCLTVTDFGENYFKVDLSKPSIQTTVLTDRPLKAVLNLERALKIGDRLGGHFVQGHIDGKGKLLKVTKDANNVFLQFEVSNYIADYLILKGSVAIDGVSLTIQELQKNIFQVIIIPHTYMNTALRFLKAGDMVNIETDMLAKYIEKCINKRKELDLNFFQRHGF